LELTARAGVELARRDGWEVHFLGQENMDATGLEQATAVAPGRYHFSSKVSAGNITTDQGPFFQITNAENSGRLNLETQPILDAQSRAWIAMDFTVPAGTCSVQIRLVRRPSLNVLRIFAALSLHRLRPPHFRVFVVQKLMI
jgi:hypothetical protein